jgi:hypothetical protein
VRRPHLIRLVLELAACYPPGRAHRIARSHGEEIFGETPLYTAWQILHDARVRPGQRFLELGCGPGRASLLGAAVYGLRCEGVERIPAFVDRGNWRRG